MTKVSIKDKRFLPKKLYFRNHCHYSGFNFILTAVPLCDFMNGSDISAWTQT